MAKISDKRQNRPFFR